MQVQRIFVNADSDQITVEHFHNEILSFPRNCGVGRAVSIASLNRKDATKSKDCLLQNNIGQVYIVQLIS